MIVLMCHQKQVASNVMVQIPWTVAHLRIYVLPNLYVISNTDEILYRQDNVYLLFHESNHDISSWTFVLTLTVCALSAREKSGKKENS